MREVWIDRWKGLLILFVVVGHVVGGAAHLATGESQDVLEGVYRVIYLFHMPAFFALAGCCWKSDSARWGSFLKKKIQRLLVPYVVFGIASVVIYLAFQQRVLSQVGAGICGYYTAMGGEPWWRPFLSLLHAGGWPNGQGFRANTSLWFLPCLFTVEMFYFLFDHAFPRRSAQLAGAVLSLSLGFVIRWCVPFALPWGLGRAPWFLSFLIAGRWLLRPMADVLSEMPFPRGGLVGCVVFCGGLYGLGGWFMPGQWLMCRAGWYVAFAALALAGTMLSLLVARCMPVRGLAFLGGMSLTIMLVHKFPVLALETQVSGIRSLFARGGFSVALGCAFVLTVALIGCGLVHGIMRKYLPFAIGLKKGENK